MIILTKFGIDQGNTKIHYEKEFNDNIFKDIVTVTSSNFSQNNGMISILTYFIAKNHSKLPETDKM